MSQVSKLVNPAHVTVTGPFHTTGIDRPMTHEERLALIYAPFPVVRVPTSVPHGCGAGRKPTLSQLDHERESW